MPANAKSRPTASAATCARLLSTLPRVSRPSSSILTHCDSLPCPPARPPPSRGSLCRRLSQSTPPNPSPVPISPVGDGSIGGGPAPALGRRHKLILPSLNKRDLKMTRYAIIIEKGQGNCSAYCPDLPGVAAAAETEEETLELMKEAMEFHLEGLREERLPIPQPTVTAR